MTVGSGRVQGRYPGGRLGAKPLGAKFFREINSIQHIFPASGDLKQHIIKGLSRDQRFHKLDRTIVKE